MNLIRKLDLGAMVWGAEPRHNGTLRATAQLAGRQSLRDRGPGWFASARRSPVLPSLVIMRGEPRGDTPSPVSIELQQSC